MSSNLTFVEGTTRIVEIHCLDKDKNDFDFNGYTIQTYVEMKNASEKVEAYLNTLVVDSTISFTIPPEMSIGMSKGSWETRIFKNGEVVSVVMGTIVIVPSPKPDIAPHE